MHGHDATTAEQLRGPLNLMLRRTGFGAPSRGPLAAISTRELLAELEEREVLWRARWERWAMDQCSR